jgi:glutathione peroxidase
MKNLLLLTSLIFFACQQPASRPETLLASNSNPENIMENTFYDFKMKDINGNEVDFNTFKGKKIMIVNVASKCGYTKQYEALQELYATHGDDIVILGFPANNFGGQEPGTNEEIKEFCDSKFGVTFPMFEKISVKGFDKHPLYRWLSDSKLNGWNNEEPGWNFCKYLINEQGELVKFLPSSVAPLDEEILEFVGI